ncbi:MAG: tetratricopeptide repeat protein [Armatimonas sp.]
MQTKDVAFLSTSGKAAYDQIFLAWSAGNQTEAERMLREAARKYGSELRLAFFAALLVRSRFDIQGAAPILAFVANRAPGTRQGLAAQYMLAIDQRRNVPQSFAALGKLAMETRPVEPLIVWLYAIAARTLRQNRPGIAAYTLLLKHVKVGSALIHQTFANLLDGDKRYAEALPHRQLAVKLEPAPWSYDGLAMTLYRLRRFDESLKIFEKAAPKSGSTFPLIWNHWGVVLSAMGRNKEALEKMERAVQLDPNDSVFRHDRDTIRARLR